jgi:hypothetical protein
MRAVLITLGVIVTMGSGVAVYLGKMAKDTQDRAKAASVRIKQDVENNRARMKLRRDWANEHEVISDISFKAFPHEPQTIGETTVSCPKCKEL